MTGAGPAGVARGRATAALPTGFGVVLDPGTRQPQHAGGCAAEQRVLIDLLGARVDDHAEAGGQRPGGGATDGNTTTSGFGAGHSASPPSTGTMAPVIPLLAGLARKAKTAATSVGSSSRPMGCWLANAWAPGSS